LRYYYINVLSCVSSGAETS